MKNRITIAGIALAATTLLLASCTKALMTEDTFVEGVFVKRTITADAGLPGTENIDKAYLDSTSRKVKWQATDELRINGTDLRVYSRDSDDVRAKFYGEVTAIKSGGYDYYWAVYPKSRAAAYSGSGELPAAYTTTKLTVTLPATQTVNTAKQPFEGYNIMAARARVPENQDRIDFQMRNLGAVLKLQLKAKNSETDKTISRIEFTTTDSKGLSGQYTVNTSGTLTAVTDKVNPKLTVYIKNGNNNYLDISTQKVVYVLLPPLPSGSNLKMRVYNNSGKYYEKSASINANHTFSRNTIYTSTTTDLVFNTSAPTFKVASGTKVVFAPGNLQYNAVTTVGSSTHWRFASNQYTRIGNNNSNISSSYDGWIDLFGWGTSGNNNKHPYMTSQTNTDYGNGARNISGTNYDWGVKNAIYNPKTQNTDPANTWRIPTSAEWKYVFDTRTTNSGKRYAKAKVANIPGIILVPDNWSTSTYTLNNYNKADVGFTTNDISAFDWVTLEDAGCVFLPAAGRRVGTTIGAVGEEGPYWSGTDYSSGAGAYDLWFSKSNTTGSVLPEDHYFRYRGASVRLVKNQ